MKLIRTLAALGCVIFFAAGPVLAAEKQEKTLTCCQEAAAQGKECRHKCCIAAHKDGKSCAKCNPNKEDLALLKKDAKKAQK
jgi:hypothetical protein